jgi:hypothetical protein
MVKTKPYVQVAIQGWPIVMGRTVCVCWMVQSLGYQVLDLLILGSLVGGI